MSDNLKKKTLTALIWSFVDKFGQQFLYFVTGIILAIPLNPVDLGKMALLAVFVALSSILIDSGFGSALIRKKEATDADYSTIFYFNIGVSLIFYLILFALAPFIESYSGVPGLAAGGCTGFVFEYCFSGIRHDSANSFDKIYSIYATGTYKYYFSVLFFGVCCHYRIHGLGSLGFSNTVFRNGDCKVCLVVDLRTLETEMDIQSCLDERILRI